MTRGWLITVRCACTWAKCWEPYRACLGWYREGLQDDRPALSMVLNRPFGVPSVYLRGDRRHCERHPLYDLLIPERSWTLVNTGDLKNDGNVQFQPPDLVGRCLSLQGEHGWRTCGIKPLMKNPFRLDKMFPEDIISHSLPLVIYLLTSSSQYSAQ